MQTTIKNLGKSSFQITVQLDTAEIEPIRKSVLGRIAKQTKIAGFRKGHVPAELVEKQIDQNFYNKEVLEEIVNQTFSKAITEQKKNPICQPKFTITKWVPFTELEYTIQIAETPTVKVADYKKEIKKHAKELKDSDAQEKIIDLILQVSEIDLPPLLQEEETNRMLTRLLEQLQKIGLTIDQFLQTKKKSAEELRGEYETLAERTLKAELAFAEIIKQEGISASEKEITEAIAAHPDPEAQKLFSQPQNRWYIESVIKRQKVIETLLDSASQGKSK